MANYTTDRAVKRAYFSDLSGGHIIEFQFSPNELEFKEGGHFIDRVMTGSYFTDSVWISGTPNNFSIQLFIDRTQESYMVENYNNDPFDGIRRFPSRERGLDIENLIRGFKNASGFAASLSGASDKKANDVTPSSYSSSPHYKQNAFDDSVGVVKDLEALMYYVRPMGLKLGTINMDSRTGSVSSKDFSQTRFSTPPKIRFYYGPFWREGYISEVNYTLSVMNKNLVPRRMDANIDIKCTKWGYLTEIASTDSGDSLRSGDRSIQYEDSARSGG